MCDSDRVRGILLNLYTNAAKFTKAGYITMRATTVDADFIPQPPPGPEYSSVTVTPAAYVPKVEQRERAEGGMVHGVGGPAGGASTGAGVGDVGVGAGGGGAGVAGSPGLSSVAKDAADASQAGGSERSSFGSEASAGEPGSSHDPQVHATARPEPAPPAVSSPAASGGASTAAAAGGAGASSRRVLLFEVMDTGRRVGGAMGCCEL